MTISKKTSAAPFLGDSHAAPNLSAPEGPFYAFDWYVLSKGGML